MATRPPEQQKAINREMAILKKKGVPKNVRIAKSLSDNGVPSKKQSARKSSGNNS